MTLNRIACPECGAGLKSSTGFAPGQAVSCPKCETEFTVEEGVTELSEVPQSEQFKKNQSDTESWSYKNSWLRYAVLGVLIAVLAVLGFMLYDKRMKGDKDLASGSDDDAGKPIEPRYTGPAQKELPRVIPRGGAAPIEPKAPEAPKAKTPTADEAKTALVGKWEAKNNGEGYTIEYVADGTFSYAVEKEGQSKKTLNGEWKLVKVEPGMDAPAARVTILNMEWAVKGKPAVKEAVLLRQDDTAGHPYLDQEIEGKKAGGMFSKKK